MKQILKTLTYKYGIYLILLLAFVVRLYHFSSPLADWHSWRQADTSSVSRNFIKFGFDVLHPKFDDLSKTPSGGLDNPMGYRFVEFPIYNLFQAGAYKLFGHYTIEEWGRLTTVFSSLFAMLFLYLILKKYVSSIAALSSAFFMGFVPFSIYYSRTILPDMTMVTAYLGAIYFFDKWLENVSKLKTQNSKILIVLYYFIAVVFSASALLLKPFAIFFMVPIAYLAWMHLGKNLYKNPWLYVYAMLTVLPLTFWRIWMLQYPEGTPLSNWLFNGNGIRFKGAFFQWIFADRIAKLILGYWGLPTVIFGLLIKGTRKVDWFFYSFLVGSLLYITIVATGNVQHDYYQIPLIPVIAIFFGKGVDFLFRAKREYYYSYATVLFVIISTAFMLIFGWYIVRDYYTIDHYEIIPAGHEVDKITPPNAKIIAAYGGDTTFLYQTNRQGWPVVDRSFKDLIKAGATYIIFVDPTTDENNLKTRFKLVEQTPSWLILDLRHPLPAEYKDLQ